MQQSYSDKADKIGPTKNGKPGEVGVTPPLLAALQVHVEAMTLAGQARGWGTEQRQLISRTHPGQIVRHGHFQEAVWASHPVGAESTAARPAPVVRRRRLGPSHRGGGRGRQLWPFRSYPRSGMRRRPYGTPILAISRSMTSFLAHAPGPTTPASSGTPTPTPLRIP